MELADVVSILRRRWPIVVLIMIVALAAGILTAYRVSGSGLEPRAFESGAATAQMLVDAPQSAIGDLRQDTAPLVARAGVLAQFMTSTEVRDEIAKAAGLQPDRLVTAGPFPGDSSGDAAPPPSSARGNEVLGEAAVYRLDFSSQPDLPIVTIVARAPDPAAAGQLADAAVRGLRDYVSRVQAQQGIQADRRVVVRSLGLATTQTVTSGPGKAMALVAAMGVAMLGLLLLVGLSRITGPRDSRSPLVLEPTPLDHAASARAPVPDPPGTAWDRRVGGIAS